MRILIHKYVFEDISKFKEVCDFVVRDVLPKNILVINDFTTMRFDDDYDEQREYDIDNYIELDSSYIDNQLEFALELEKGNYPI